MPQIVSVGRLLHSKTADDKQKAREKYLIIHSKRLILNTLHNIHTLY